MEGFSPTQAVFMAHVRETQPQKNSRPQGSSNLHFRYLNMFGDPCWDVLQELCKWIISPLYQKIVSPAGYKPTYQLVTNFHGHPTVDGRHPKQPHGMYQTLQIMWYTTNLNWLAGFLSSKGCSWLTNEKNNGKNYPKITFRGLALALALPQRSGSVTMYGAVGTYMLVEFY